MNKSTSFQPVGGVILSGIPPRCFPAFLAVWGGQTKRESAFLHVKLHAARFQAAAGLAARAGVLLCIGGKPLLQGGIVGADMDKGGLSRQTKQRQCLLFGKTGGSCFITTNLVKGAIPGPFSR
ncbi:MAG TPA: hypothetical protein IAC21_03115 [Candidatus Enterenecus merdae]|nr:hypothetical protein [Candidatus Enterenecus merdae]